MKYSTLVLLLFLCGCVNIQTEQGTYAPRPDGTSIPPGRLGYSLGTYLTIEGVRMEEGKVGTRTLRVDTVNGRKLKEPVSVWIDNVKHPGLPSNTRCVIRGYESGRMIGIPHAVAMAENLPSPQAAWQFRRYFIMTSAVEPLSLEKQWPPKP